MVTQYFVTLVGQHLQWLEFHIKIIGMAGRNVLFLPKRLEKVAFSENLAGVSTLTQWTPCTTIVQCRHLSDVNVSAIRTIADELRIP